MSVASVNRVVRALLEQLNVERVINADALAASLDEVTSTFLDKLVRATVRATFVDFTFVGRIKSVLQGLPNAWADEVGKRMTKLAFWASERSAVIFTTAVPRSWMATQIEDAQRRSGVKETPLERIHEMPKDEYERLVRRYILPPRTKAEIERTVYRPAIFIADDGKQETFEWDAKIRELSRVVDPERVTQKLIAATQEEKSVAQIAKILVEETKGIGHSARRIARTETMRQMNDEIVGRYADLGDMWIGVQYLATLDERVRPEHAINHGKIWWRDGKLPPLKDMPIPPIAPNCRCSTAPVLSPPQEALDDPTFLAELRASGGTSGPDIVTQQQWWKTADEARKRISVGSKRYDSMRSILGREPDWIDFIADNGRLLKIKELEAETSIERGNRRAAILTALTMQGQQVSQIGGMQFLLPS
jgi:SPP1 gp7 family putative phage head morphogenesis protein